MTGRTVWLASYPKSGNTWLRAVYAAATSGADVDLDRLGGGTQPAALEAFDLALGIAGTDLTADELDLLRPRADEVYAAAATGPVPRKVHDAFLPGPAGEPVLSVAATRGAVYVVRDPRDVAVSYAHHTGRSVTRTAEFLGDPDAAMAGGRRGPFRHGRQRLGTWSQHVRSWLDQDRVPVHLLRYEDATADPVGVFGPALRFCGLDLTEAAVARAVERASFGRLAAQESRSGFRERTADDRVFFRRGQAGGWRDELPAHLAERIVADHNQVMTRLGYLD